MGFQEKVVIITGGAQGIGKAMAQHFLNQGVTVVVTDIDNVAGKETEKEFKALGNILFVKADNSSEKDIKNVIDIVIKHFKRIDYLINNAATFHFKPLAQLSLKEWNEVINTNLTGTFLFSKYATPYLQKAHGAIVNIASTRALMSEPGNEAYAASKGGIVALTQALAISLGPDVRVNSISPGWIDVSQWKKSSKRHQEKLSKEDNAQHPVGRVGVPHDIAAMAFYLLSKDAEFITGQNFIVDGGMTKKMIYV